MKKIFQRNQLGFGILAGLLVPAAAFGLLWSFFELLDTFSTVTSKGLSNDFRYRTLAIVAIGCNAILMNGFFKAKSEASMRGVTLPTFIFIGAWLYFFGQSVL